MSNFRNVFLTSAATVCLLMSDLPAKAAVYTCTWLESGKAVGNTCKIDSSTHNICSYTFSTKMPVSCLAAPAGKKTGMECIFITAGSKAVASMTMGESLDEAAQAMHAVPGYYSGAIAIDANADLALLVGVKESSSAPEIDARCMP